MVYCASCISAIKKCCLFPVGAAPSYSLGELRCGLVLLHAAQACYVQDT
jgi:hypothetical protein